MSYGTATPHIASYVILRRDGKIAFVLRANTKWMNGYYGLPSGKVEQDESFEQAAIREAKEEAGVTIAQKDLQHVLTMHRTKNGEEEGGPKDWVDCFFEPVKWQGEAVNAEPHMHSELVWLDPNNLPENVIPSVRYAIEQIEQGSHYAEFGWQ